MFTNYESRVWWFKIHKCIQRDLEAGIPVWAPKIGAQKGFLVQHILSSIHSGK